jgi:hypothetical protein
MLLSFSVYVYQNDEGELNIKFEGVLAEYAVAAGESGWLEIYIYPHSGDPATDYAENDSATLEAASLTYADTDGWANTVDSETLFDIVIRCRFNATHAKNATMFKDTRTKVNLNVTGDWAVGSDISDEEGTAVVTENASTHAYIWINFYWNNSGSGYSIDDEGTLTFSAPQIQAKY